MRGFTAAATQRRGYSSGNIFSASRR